MEFEITKQAKVQLLGRERITGFIHFEGNTPSRIEIKKSLAQKIKANEDNVVIRHIYQRYGEHKAKFIAHIYEDQKLMKQLEPENLLKKHNPATKEENVKKEDKKEEKKE